MSRSRSGKEKEKFSIPRIRERKAGKGILPRTHLTAATTTAGVALTPCGKEKPSHRERTSRHHACLTRGIGAQGTVAQSARRRRAQPRASTRAGEGTGGGATISRHGRHGRTLVLARCEAREEKERGTKQVSQGLKVPRPWRGGRTGQRRGRRPPPPSPAIHGRCCFAWKRKGERKNKARGRRPFTAAHRAAGGCVRAGHGGPVATANGAAAPPPLLGLVERTETEKGRNVQGLRAAMAWPWRGGWTGRRGGEGPAAAPPDARGRDGREAIGLGFSRERQPAPGFDPAKSTESRRIRSDGQDRPRAAGGLFSDQEQRRAGPIRRPGLRFSGCRPRPPRIEGPRAVFPAGPKNSMEKF